MAEAFFIGLFLFCLGNVVTGGVDALKSNSVRVVSFLYFSSFFIVLRKVLKAGSLWGDDFMFFFPSGETNMDNEYFCPKFVFIYI